MKTKSKPVALVVAFLSFVYLLNPTLGVFELFPDNFPGIGNLDEGAAGALLLWALSVLRRKPELPSIDERTDRS